NMLSAVLEKGGEIDPDDLFTILRDEAHAPDHELPDTGAGDVWERILSPLFITSRIYGTRCSSIILMDKNDDITFYEKTFYPKKGEIAEESTVRFSIRCTS
ncbi:MAG: NRDE family protein, partial [Desulfobacterales bacterium]